MTPLIPPEVLSRWSRLSSGTVRPFGTGLINKTFLVETPGARAVVQRLHHTFKGTVNHDIDAVTRHLENKGLVTPRVVPTDDGALFATDSSGEDGGRVWRALTVIQGTSVDRVDSPKRAFAGGALVARFHGAVNDLDYQYQHVRPGVHDVKRHVAVLEKAVADHPSHRLFQDVAPIARSIIDTIKSLPDLSTSPLRHAHGDLKISNVLFDDAGNGVCLVDLDTLARMQWPFEMGDALRSWCNPAGEDVAQAEIDVDIFRAAVEGYASRARGLISTEERARLVDGTLYICTELSARFLADALNESYFGWNADQYQTRGDHNLLRARGQWALATSVAQKKNDLESIVTKAFVA